MQIKTLVLATGLLLFVFSVSRGQEHRVEMIDQPPKSDAVSAELAKLFSNKGYRVIRGKSRTVCELWMCKQWEIDPKFEATDDRLYPFHPGELIGLLHFKRRGSEFRDQTVGSGWYTLRFELQPTDGNHEGTSPTRDFLLMVDAELDTPDKDWGQEALQEVSSEAAGASHPAMLCLQPASEDKKIAIRHDEQRDWWVLHVVGKGVADGKSKELSIDVVVSGHADE